MMKDRIAKREKHGKREDEWVTHPLPTLNEPEKTMSWLTADPDLDENRMADMFLREGLGVIDNVLLKVRRLYNAVERPIDTADGNKAVWHGYAPHNPAMIEKHLAIFRAVNNFVFVGEDGATLAMRLGFARQPLDFEDIVWPGQRVPRPKRVRRRGKRLLQPELLKRLRTEGATIPCQDTSLLVYCPFRRDDKLELPWLNT